MRWRVQDIECLRESARKAGSLPGIREYYRERAEARQRESLCVPERELAAVRRRRPETQNTPSVGS